MRVYVSLPCHGAAVLVQRVAPPALACPQMAVMWVRVRVAMIRDDWGARGVHRVTLHTVRRDRTARSHASQHRLYVQLHAASKCVSDQTEWWDVQVVEGCAVLGWQGRPGGRAAALLAQLCSWQHVRLGNRWSSLAAR